MSNWFSKAFYPHNVAVFGASNTPGKHGNVLFRNLSQSFQGTLYPIHLRETAIEGCPTFRSLDAISEAIDLAVIATPLSFVPMNLFACGKAGISVAIVLTAGFAERGTQGLSIQNELLSIAKKAGIRLVGPNSFGLVNTHNHLNISFGLGLPKPGKVSLISQSGAYCMAAYTRSNEGGIGFAKIISLGNKADLDETEVLRFLGKDNETQVIAVFIESFSNGQAFYEECRQITPRKPVIVLKTARAKSGKRAAQSHTAALANDFAVVDAVLRQAGARMVKDGQCLFDTAAGLTNQPPLNGNRLAIISNSGGTAVELTDLLEEQGFQVPKLSPPLRKRIQARIPGIGSTGNPIDITTDWTQFPDAYGNTLRELLDSDEIDGVIPILLQRSALMANVTKRLIETVTDAQNRGCKKPVHVCWVAGLEAEDNRKRLWDHKIPSHFWPTRTAQALSACLNPTLFDRCVQPFVENKKPTIPHNKSWLLPDQCDRILADGGMPVVRSYCFECEAGLFDAAEKLQFPVVLKAVRPKLVHKTDAGAVRLNIENQAALKKAVKELKDRLGDGPFQLQKQVKPGSELLLGAFRDPSFGPILLFGVGGFLTELAKDTVIRHCPIGIEEAFDLTYQIRSQVLFDGFRGLPPVDRSSLAKIISSFSLWIASRPWILEIDLNPIIGRRDKFSLVDARILVDTGYPL